PNGIGHGSVRHDGPHWSRRRTRYRASLLRRVRRSARRPAPRVARQNRSRRVGHQDRPRLLQLSRCRVADAGLPQRRRPEMKNWLAGFLLATMWAAALWIAMTPEIAGGHGAMHTRFTQMDQGGAGMERHGPVFAAAWSLGAAMIAMFVCLLAWQTKG